MGRKPLDPEKGPELPHVRSKKSRDKKKLVDVISRGQTDHLLGMILNPIRECKLPRISPVQIAQLADLLNQLGQPAQRDKAARAIDELRQSAGLDDWTDTFQRFIQITGTVADIKKSFD